MKIKMISIFLTLIAASCSKRYNHFNSVPEFKFNIIRTFHKPLYFQTVRDSNSTFLMVQVFSGKGGYDEGKLESIQKIKLDTNQTSIIIELLNRLNFSKLNQTEELIGNDGSSWEFEILQNSKYSFSRWTPNYNAGKRNLKDLVRFGKYIWKIGNIGEPENNFY